MKNINKNKIDIYKLKNIYMVIKAVILITFFYLLNSSNSNLEGPPKKRQEDQIKTLEAQIRMKYHWTKRQRWYPYKPVRIPNLIPRNRKAPKFSETLTLDEAESANKTQNWG